MGNTRGSRLGKFIQLNLRFIQIYTDGHRFVHLLSYPPIQRTFTEHLLCARSRLSSRNSYFSEKKRHAINKCNANSGAMIEFSTKVELNQCLLD